MSATLYDAFGIQLFLNNSQPALANPGSMKRPAVPGR
jgi:hypothetical protein